MFAQNLEEQAAPCSQQNMGGERQRLKDVLKKC